MTTRKATGDVEEHDTKLASEAKIMQLLGLQDMRKREQSRNRNASPADRNSIENAEDTCYQNCEIFM